MAGMSIGSSLFALASLLVLGREWRRDPAELRARLAVFRPYFLCTAALFLAAAWSLLYAGLVPPLGGAELSFVELKKFHFFLIPVFVALAFLEPSAEGMERHPFWKFWAWMGIVCAGIALLQYFGGYIFPADWLAHRFFRPVIGSKGIYLYHGQGLMFFHLSFASCMSFVAAAGIARALWPLAGDSALARRFWFLVGAAGLLAVFLSYSRTALVVAVVIATALLALKRPRWGLVALVGFAIAGATVWFTTETLRNRFALALVKANEREDMWRTSWVMFRERPLSGIGFARTGGQSAAYAEKAFGFKPEFNSHAHNNLLDIAAATGLPGLLAFIAWWGMLIGMAWVCFRRANDREKWLPAAAFMGLVAFQLNGLTQVNSWDGKSLHTPMIWAGVTLALYIREKQRSGKKHGRRCNC